MGSWRKYQSPIWRYEIEWERYQRETGNERYARRAADTAYSFLDTYPEKRNPEDFCITDVQDWAIVRERVASKATVELELGMLQSFFQWLRDSKGVTAPNPVHVPKRVRSRSTTPRLSLAALRGLVNAATQPADRQLLREVLTGASLNEASDRLHLSYGTIRSRFVRLKELSQLPPEINLRNLRRGYLDLSLRLGERAVFALLFETAAVAEVPTERIATVRPVVAPRVVAAAADLAPRL